MPKKKAHLEHLFDFVLLLKRLQSIHSCETRTSKIVEQKAVSSINSPSQENISQNPMLGSEKDSKNAAQQYPEVENVQNEKRLLCKKIHDNYFNEESHIYLIPISNKVLRSSLGNALVTNNKDENFSKIIDETIEDVHVWTRLSEACEIFLNQSVLQSQNSSVAKSVAVLLSIL